MQYLEPIAFIRNQCSSTSDNAVNDGCEVTLDGPQYESLLTSTDSSTQLTLPPPVPCSPSAGTTDAERMR